MAFDSTVIVLRIGPVAILYFTSIFPFFPGRIGASGFVGTVHPQVESTLVIIRGASPVLVNSKTRIPESVALVTFP